MLRVLARLFLNASLHLSAHIKILAKLQYTNFPVDAKDLSQQQDVVQNRDVIT